MDTRTLARPADDEGDAESSDGAKVSRVQNHIRELILTGELAPGRPVRERALAERLGVSRTPMREALKMLAAEHLVVLHPNRGATVAVLGREEVHQVVEVLASLEGLAAELACPILTDAEIGELWGLHYEMLANRSRQDRLGYFHNNQAIHLGIVRAARNEVLAELHRVLNARVYRLRFMAHQALQGWNSAVQEHEEIIRALESRDAEKAGPLLRAHVFGIWTRLEYLLDEDGTLRQPVTASWDDPDFAKGERPSREAR